MALRNICNDFNAIVNRVEKGFNVAGAVPILGTVGSIMRMMAAKLQILAGVIFAIIGAVGYVVTSMFNSNLSSDFDDLTRFGMQHVGHGFLDYGRSLLEIVGQVTTLGVANIIVNCIPTPVFSPFVDYGRI